MDPLDQRLTDAGTAWRQSQPEPPDIDRLVAGLDRRRSRIFSPRLVVLFAAGLVLIGAVAALGAGGFFDGRNGVPVAPIATAIPSPTPTPSAVPATPEATSPASNSTQATNLLNAYETALVDGQWQAAFDMLAPTSPTRDVGFEAYASERAAYFTSVAGRYTMGAPDHDVPDWSTYAPLIDGADVTHAYVIEVDYPALSGNNAGYEQFVVAPDASGTWRIWPVR